MDAGRLRTLDVEELSDYTWKRLRLEQPMDPPLHERFRMEPPEEFLITAYRNIDDAGFRRRLREAILLNLRRVALLAVDDNLDSRAYEQVASLAYLADAIGDGSLAHPLYLFALTWQSQIEQGDTSDLAFFHLLRTIARLQNDPGLVPFWERLWKTLDSGNLRAIAYYGLTLADTDRALSHLPELVADARIDLPVTAWSLVTEHPGAILLGKAAAKMAPSLRARLRSALVSAGADEALLQDFDLRGDGDRASGDFPFEVPSPKNTEVARVRPLLAAA